MAIIYDYFVNRGVPVIRLQMKTGRKIVSQEQWEEEKERQFELKQQKRKDKK